MWYLGPFCRNSDGIRRCDSVDRNKKDTSMLHILSAYQTSEQCFSCTLIGYSNLGWHLLFNVRHCFGIRVRIFLIIQIKRELFGACYPLVWYQCTWSNYSPQCWWRVVDVWLWVFIFRERGLYWESEREKEIERKTKRERERERERERYENIYMLQRLNSITFSSKTENGVILFKKKDDFQCKDNINFSDQAGAFLCHTYRIMNLVISCVRSANAWYN